MTAEPRSGTRTHTDWCAYAVDVESILERAMVETGYALAVALGWQSDLIEGDGEMIPCPSDDDIVRALQQPFPLTAVFETPYRSPQPPLWEWGDGEWLTVERVAPYALRQSRRTAVGSSHGCFPTRILPPQSASGPRSASDSAGMCGTCRLIRKEHEPEQALCPGTARNTPGPVSTWRLPHDARSSGVHRLAGCAKPRHPRCG
jgi:hypothetical protein